MSWTPVSKSKPCAICGHGSWCTRGDYGVCCMWVKSNRRLKNGGYFHSSSGAQVSSQINYNNKLSTWHDVASIASGYKRQITQPIVAKLAKEIGVSVDSLLQLDVGWSNIHEAYCFPMRNETGKIIGIRTRTLSGEKKTISGTKSGLFIPHTKPTGVVVICEGPTDCAAMLTLGTYALGRPSCIGCEEMLAGWLKNNAVSRFVIVPDSDEPGVKGAKELQSVIGGDVIVPPAKDARAWVNSGLTREGFLKELRHRGLLPTVSTPPSLIGHERRGTQPCESPAGGNDLPGEAVASAPTTARAYLRPGSDPQFHHKSRLCRNPDNLVPRTGRFASVASTSVRRTTLVACASHYPAYHVSVNLGKHYTFVM